MVRMKLRDVRLLIDPLKKISSQEFPIKYSWKIMNLCDTVEKLMERIETCRIQLVEKYGEVVYVCNDIENNTEITFSKEEYDKGIDETKYSLVNVRKEVRDKENFNKFYVELNELLALEEDVISEQIDISDMTDKITASAQELFILKKVFKFE